MSTLGNNLLAQYYAQNQGLPFGYEAVEYLESTGTQYINTYVKLSGDLTIQCRAQNKYRVSSIIRGSTIVNNVRYNIFILTGSREPNVQAAYNPSRGNDNLQIDNVAFDSWFDAKLTNRTLTVNGISISTESSSFPDTNGYMYISAIVVDDVITPSSAVFANIKIEKAKTTIRNFIPCVRLSDNKPGLYDLCGSICPLTGTPFYVNAGTGEFVIPT